MRSALVLMVVAACGTSATEKGVVVPGSGAAATPERALAQFAGVELPDVAPSVGAAPERGPTVHASMTELNLDDERVATLLGGHLDATEVEGGSKGFEISKLRGATTRVATATTDRPSARVGLAFDRRQTYGLLVQTIYSMKSEPGFEHFGLYARSGDATVMLPIDLPDPTRSPASSPAGASTPGAGPAAPAPTAPAGAAPGPVGPRLSLFVSITPTEVLVWSASGLEGTLKSPKLKVARSPTAMRAVNETLAEIVSRRWPSEPPTRERQIVLQAGVDVPIQVIADAMAAVHATAGSRPLFPDVLLSAGFE